MRTQIILTFLLVVAVLASTPAAAHAGRYTVSSCNDARGSDGWAPEPSYYVGAFADCSVHSNGGAPFFSNARVLFTAPPGTTVVGIRGKYTSTQQGGWQVGIYDFDAPAGGRQWLWCGPGTQCTTFGQSPAFAADSFRSGHVGVLQICGADPCNNPSGFRASEVGVTLEDPSPPTLSVDVPEGWVRGTQAIGVEANDNVGVQATPIEIDGREREAARRSCDYSRAKPCPNGGGRFSLNTSDGLVDGTHAVTLKAVDAAGNVASTGRALLVDNTAPGQVAEMAVAGGNGWRTQNRFALTWRMPAQVGVSPIAAIEYEVCPVGSAAGAPDCRRGTKAAADVTPESPESPNVLEGLAVPGPGEWRASVWLRDEAGNQNPDTAMTSVLRFDDSPPVARFRPTDPTDPTRVRVASTDGPSGVASAAIELQRRGESTWRTLDVQMEEGGFAASLDDVNLPDGAYALRARAVDRAGNERSTASFDDGKPAELSLPVRIKTRLAAGKAKRVPSRRRSKSGKRRYRTKLITRPEVGYGSVTRLQGRLTTPGGNPVTRTDVQVSEQLQVPGAAPRPIGTVTTSHTGRFSFKVAKGPSRIVSFRYAGTRTVRADVADVAVRVRASTSFTVSRRSVVNGQAVTFSGRLRGANVPAEGKLVALQARSRGRWRPFATTRASPQNGRWTYAYRFDGTRGKVRYRFRARVLREATYPFTTGTSGTRRVLVQGI